MRKQMYIIIALMLFGIGIVSAVTSGPITVVYGKVTHLNGSIAVNAKMNINCNGLTKTTTTNSQGLYQVSYAGSQCPVGSSVSIVARNNYFYGVKVPGLVYSYGIGGVKVIYNGVLGYNQANKNIVLNKFM